MAGGNPEHRRTYPDGAVLGREFGPAPQCLRPFALRYLLSYEPFSSSDT